MHAFKFFFLTAAILASQEASAVLNGPGDWQITLQGRNAAGEAVAADSASAVFLYDTTLNITWLRNANIIGAQLWSTAEAWASNLSVDGITGWRLPTTMQPDPSCSKVNDPGGGQPLQSYGQGCVGSELGHLWRVSLGNIPTTYVVPYGVAQTGPFIGMQDAVYWSSTPYVYPGFAYNFGISEGYQDIAQTASQRGYAIAVRSGDVLVAVPEPSSWAMLGAGLSLIGLMIRRRKN